MLLGMPLMWFKGSKYWPPLPSSTSLLFLLPCRYCDANPNKAFASCSVPQELTNEEIDEADESGEVRAC